MTSEVEYRRRGWWSCVTAWNLFAVNALVHPDRIAVSDPPNRAAVMHGMPRELSYTALQYEVEVLARRLTRLGVGGGDVVVVQLPNVVESLIVFLTAARLGFLYSPVPVQYREYELRYVIGYADAVMGEKLCAILVQKGMNGRPWRRCAVFCATSAKWRNSNPLKASCGRFRSHAMPWGRFSNANFGHSWRRTPRN